jgi:hypothetical protein
MTLNFSIKKSIAIRNEKSTGEMLSTNHRTTCSAIEEDE